MIGEATATVYEVLFQKGRKVRRWNRLLRPDEVDDCLELFNRFSDANGIKAIAKPICVQLTRLDGDFDGEW
jgi:hypothetical protein